MTSDSIRPIEQRYNYRNAVTGLVQLVKEEGLHGLFRGMGTNLVRTHHAHFLHVYSRQKQTRAILMNVSSK